MIRDLPIRTGAATSGRAFVLVCALALAGCDYLPFGYTSVNDITQAPGRFEGREVKIKGHAEGATSLLGFRAFVLRDDAGEILVVTAGELPASGDSVALKGIVKSAMIVGGTSVGLRVEETERLR